MLKIGFINKQINSEIEGGGGWLFSSTVVTYQSLRLKYRSMNFFNRSFFFLLNIDELENSLSVFVNYDLWYQLVNTKTEVLPLATSHRANVHLCNGFSHVFALLVLVSTPHFKSINFYQTRPKIKFFRKKIQNFWALGAPLSDPRNRTPSIADFWLHAWA